MPEIQAPQDAVDAGVQIPNTGFKIAVYSYDTAMKSGVFIIVKDGVIISSEDRDNIVIGAELGLLAGCESFVLEKGQNSIEMIFSCAYPWAVVLANSIDLNLSHSFIEALENKGIVVEIVSPEEFQDFVNADTIIILGGPDAPEGVGNITRTILSEREQEYLRIEGNRGMFVYDNPWELGSDKKISIIAGSDRYQTKLAADENVGRFLV